ncbi:MotE family protein [Leptospirillum ferriphilum]|uniref:MotE family protein n=1 Tax=Leptospirillum ferriphilum TaxID=178606 RepID=UPI003F65602C
MKGVSGPRAFRFLGRALLFWLCLLFQQGMSFPTMALAATSPDPVLSPDDRLALVRKEEKRLLEIRQDLQRQIEINRKIERAIDRDRKFAEKLESKKMQHLIAIYEKMAPRTAASQINIMPRKLVAVLIAGMNPRKASRIMRYVDPQVAVRITTDLTGRPVTARDLKGSP